MIKAKLVAEFLGTFFLVFFGCGCLVSSPTMVPFAFGLIVMIMIYSLGHLSGAHFNPAVTLAFSLKGHFPKNQILPYWLVQFLGGIVASGLLHLILPGATELSMTLPKVPTINALVWEFILTFVLMFSIMAVSTDSRAIGILSGITIGSAVILGALVGGPVTGASMNPARSLGPAILNGNFSDLWIYFLGPMLGAAAAAIVYNGIRCDNPDQAGKNVKGCC